MANFIHYAEKRPRALSSVHSAHRRPFSSLLYFGTYLEKITKKTNIYYFSVYDLFGHIFYGLMNLPPHNFQSYFFRLLISAIKSKPSGHSFSCTSFVSRPIDGEYPEKPNSKMTNAQKVELFKRPNDQKTECP